MAMIFDDEIFNDRESCLNVFPYLDDIFTCNVDDQMLNARHTLLSIYTW